MEKTASISFMLKNLKLLPTKCLFGDSHMVGLESHKPSKLVVVVLYHVSREAENKLLMEGKYSRNAEKVSQGCCRDQSRSRL